MDRYHRVEKPRAETPIDENEIRITSQGRMRNYITYAMTLLQVSLHMFGLFAGVNCLSKSLNTCFEFFTVKCRLSMELTNCGFCI